MAHDVPYRALNETRIERSPTYSRCLYGDGADDDDNNADEIEEEREEKGNDEEDKRK